VKRALAIFGLVFPAFAQIGIPYDGPAVLTRGQAPSSMAGEEIDFQPYVEIMGVYDNGLATVVNNQAEIGNAGAAGIEVAGGISGTHKWKHTVIGLDYRGDVRDYDRQTYFNGTDQYLLLGVSQELTRHITLTLREAAGIFSMDYGIYGLPETVPFDPTSSYIPNTNFLNNQTEYLSTQADVTIQKTRRLSFDFGGDGFLVRRESTALYGVTGAAGRADVQYRWSRRTTIGAAYSYTNFTFSRVFSGTDLNSIVGSYAVQVTRNLEFTAFAGGMREETKFIQSIPLSPVVAELLGVAEGNVIYRSVSYMPTYNGRVSRTFHSGVAYTDVSHTVVPGNGLFLTSKITSIAAGYSYTGLRRWSFTSGFSADFATSQGNVTGAYSDYGGMINMSRQISGAVHFIASAYIRKYASPVFPGYNQPIYGVRIGFGFAPGDVPLRLW
jgi:hypothetical protein